MKQIYMVLGFIGLILPTTAVFAADAPASQPQYDIKTGDDLHRACANPASATVTAAERDRLLVCGAYIRGYLGYYSAQRSLGQAQPFCLPPEGVGAEKLRVLYLAVLRRRPRIGDYPAALDFASVLKAAYPCAAATKAAP